MNIERKYTAIQLGSKITNRTVEPTFEYGVISGPYYNEKYPKEEFDTEEDAIDWAYNIDKYSRWMIVPIITFND